MLGRKNRPAKARRQLVIGAGRTELSANFTSLIDAIRSEAAAERAEEQREDRGKRLREWVTIFLVVATLMAVSWQVHEMIKVYQPIKDQADAAVRSAEAAMKQSMNSERTLIQTQRAWVGPRNVAFLADPAIGKAIEINIEYQNSGREPATSFRYFTEPFAMEPSDDANGALAGKINNYMKACRNNKEWQGGSVVYPMATAIGPGYNLFVKSNEDFVDEAIVRGDKIIVVQGCFWYTTIELPKHTYFCYFYKHGVTKIQNLNICASGHDAD
jgi:hypothetical protein